MLDDLFSGFGAGFFSENIYHFAREINLEITEPFKSRIRGLQEGRDYSFLKQFFLDILTSPSTQAVFLYRPPRNVHELELKELQKECSSKLLLTLPELNLRVGLLLIIIPNQIKQIYGRNYLDEHSKEILYNLSIKEILKVSYNLSATLKTIKKDLSVKRLPKEIKTEILLDEYSIN